MIRTKVLLGAVVVVQGLCAMEADEKTPMLWRQEQKVASAQASLDKWKYIVHELTETHKLYRPPLVLFPLTLKNAVIAVRKEVWNGVVPEAYFEPAPADIVIYNGFERTSENVQRFLLAVYVYRVACLESSGSKPDASLARIQKELQKRSLFKQPSFFGTSREQSDVYNADAWSALVVGNYAGAQEYLQKEANKDKRSWFERTMSTGIPPANRLKTLQEHQKKISGCQGAPSADTAMDGIVVSD